MSTRGAARGAAQGAGPDGGTVLLLSGPNLSLLGDRQPEIYGTATLDDHVKTAVAAAEELGLVVEHLQSESEAELIRHYTLTPADLELAADRHGAHNRLGFAVQLCLLRHPGFGLRAGERVPERLLDYLAHQVGVPTAAFRDYSRRAQTRLDHGGEIAAHLGLRTFTRADLPLALDCAAAAAWSTDKGEPIAHAIIDGLRAAKLILPSPDTIERAGLAGRARARRRAAEVGLPPLSGGCRSED